ncbi:nucleoside recognition domain-containing protein [Staphylospora marina]|uniref:nucleoside recognition domain-containing protein n=1 Tax=Staphylospora marina TaxID=2490858 RepID=UPI000F5BDD1E|nr:nucleoside recognition domain-containing protein [Staphylospora marina]
MSRINWRKGFESGWKTALELVKVVFPVALAVHLAKQTPLLDLLADLLSPVMGWFGLGGEAAIPLVLGNVLNLYAALGAIQALDLTVKQVFVLAVMLSFSHNLFIETALCRRVGVSALLIASVRVGLALVSALLIHWLVPFGDRPAGFRLVSGEPAGENTWMEVAGSAILASLEGVIQLVVIVIPLMLMIQVLKDLGVMERTARLLAPAMKLLGIAPTGAVTLASGLFAGLFFGAGLIIQEAREQNLSRRDIALIMVFLAACHAVVEDTLVFVPLGIPVLPLLLIRLAAAILITLVIARLWKVPAVQSYATAGDGKP